MIAVAILDAVTLGGVAASLYSIRKQARIKGVRPRRFPAAIAAPLLVIGNIALLYMAAKYFPVAALILIATLVIVGALVAR